MTKMEFSKSIVLLYLISLYENKKLTKDLQHNAGVDAILISNGDKDKLMEYLQILKKSIDYSINYLEEEND